MKILITADWHISTTRGLPKDVMVARYKSLVQEIYGTYLANNCSALWILGDTLDKAKPNIDEIGLFLWTLDFFEHAEVPTVITNGNHEAISRNQSFLNPFVELNKNFKFVRIITDIWNASWTQQHPAVFLGYSWIKNQKELPEPGDGEEILCSHARGTIEQFFVKEEYPFERFEQSKFKKVFLGDIHVGHQYSDKVYYPGAPCDIKFGGKVTDTVIVYDTETDIVEYHKINSIPLEVFRINIDEIDIQLEKHDFSKAHTRIVITGDRERIQLEKDAVLEKIDQIEKPDGICIMTKFQPDPVKFDLEARFDFTRDDYDKIDPLSVEELEVYLDYIGIENKDKIISEFMEIL